MLHHIKINNKTHEVLLRKSKRAKRLQLKIYPTGEINLVIPCKYSYKDALDFLGGQTKWVEKKLSKLASYRNKFRYLGYEIKLSISTDKKDKLFAIFFNDRNLIFPAAEDKTPEQLFETWLFEEAEKYIPSRVNRLASLYDFNFEKVKVKRLKSRWGSCSSKKNLSFNYKLMQFNYKIIDYVIVHELCHLKEMNHSEKFWSLVEEIIPDYRKYKSKLNHNQ